MGGYYGLADIATDLHKGMQQNEDREHEKQNRQMGLDERSQMMDMRNRQDQRASRADERAGAAAARASDKHEVDMDKMRLELKTMQENAEKLGMKSFYERLFFMGDKAGAIAQWNERHKDKKDYQFADAEVDKDGNVIVTRVTGERSSVPKRMIDLLFGIEPRAKGGKSSAWVEKVNLIKEMMPNATEQQIFDIANAKSPEQIYTTIYTALLSARKTDFDLQDMPLEEIEKMAMDRAKRIRSDMYGLKGESGGGAKPAGKYDPKTGKFTMFK